MAHRGGGRIIVGSYEFHFAEPQAQYIDSFLNQVSVFVAGVPKFDGGNANE